MAFLMKNKQEIDLVIWDFHMPDINGLDALNTIGKGMDLPVASKYLCTINYTNISILSFSIYNVVRHFLINLLYDPINVKLFVSSHVSWLQEGNGDGID